MHLPPAFTTRLQAQLGPEWAAFVAALDEPAPVSLRWHPDKLSPPAELDAVPWAAQGQYLPERPAFGADPWWHGGAYYVQEASSMLLEQALRQHLDLTQPLRALDLCGAPGGKATHVASLLPAGSLLVANEVIRARAGILAENLARWGVPGSLVTQNDPRDFAALPGFFDLMVVDAPCSGEGLFRRDPAAVSEWSEAHLQLCTDRQRRILMDAWPALRPGGLLVYSTCTFHPGENEENLAWLAAEAGAETLGLDLPASWGWVEVKTGALRGYQAWPHRLRGEGFFLAVVRKPGEGPAAPPRPGKRPLLAPASRAQREAVQPWLGDPAPWGLVTERDRLRVLPAGQVAAAETVTQALRVIQAGVLLAEVKGKDLRPAPEAALWAGLDATPFAPVDLSRAEAQAFLQREAPVVSGPNGWRLVRYRGLPLGWLKAMPQRSNNYYPQAWRLRQLPPEGTPLASDHVT